MSKRGISLYFVIASIGIASFFFFGSSANAQSLTDLSISASPSSPNAFEIVQVQAKSFQLNLAGLPITWYVNDKEVASGVGKVTAQFTAGDVGASSKIDVVVKRDDGTSLRETLTLVPSAVDLLWEAPNSYVPPFYKGKALAITGAPIRFTAIPNLKLNSTTKVAISDAVYTWQENGRVIESSSGHGKSSMTIGGGFPGDSKNASVTVKSRDNSISSRKTIQVPVTQPKILLYEKNITTGVLGQAKKQILSLGANTISLVAQPFFFSVRTTPPKDLGFGWRMNGATLELEDKTRANEVTLQPGGASGVAEISVDVASKGTTFQKGTETIFVRFGEEQL